jgi:hypothetical protein
VHEQSLSEIREKLAADHSERESREI